ncbi:MAG: ATP phosphoribosyltransferase regulatory subunit [Candidatus Rokuibacteriota bacterium]|nr:MAG: ATP phosphoribosyltransferase regulatory subunit [Candidatus Rokubacteria bacterium]
MGADATSRDSTGRRDARRHGRARACRARASDRRPRRGDGDRRHACDRPAPHRAGRAGPRARAALVRRRVAGRHHGDRVRRRLGHRASHEHAGPSRGATGGQRVKPVHSQLPKGARIYLPDEAARKRYVEERLLDVFARWGYREIVTPTFEFADVLAMGTDVGVQESMFKFVDRETGRMLALRADITPQIARVVATRLRDEPKPVRLAYVTNVFRHDEPQMSHYREFYQAGVELIGLEKPEAEVEVIAMTIEGLRALGLERFQIDLGHPDFFRGLLDEASTDATRRQALREALARKDASTLERLVREVAPAPHVAEALLALPTLFGREIVLERAGRYAQNARSARALGNLAEVYRLLRIYGLSDSVLLDLGEVRGFDYYSGLYFEAYVSGFGAALAGGGRYDDMLGRFGYDCPAVGFAFDIARALAIMENQQIPVELPGPDFFIIDFTPEKTAALSLARRLRDLGASVARDIISRGLEESIDYARAQRMRHVLVVGSPRTGAGELLALDLKGGGERTLAIADVLADPAKSFEGVGGRAHA